MAKILVVYYSLTGHTHEIAQAVAGACGADTERIADARSRAGLLGYLRSGRQAWTKRAAAIRPTEKNPGDYDLVVLGTPVWAWNLSAPMRAYLAQQGAAFRKVAFFCTEGGSGGERVFRQMAGLCGQTPAATLIVTEPEIKKARYADKVAAFCKSLAGAASESHPAAPADADG